MITKDLNVQNEGTQPSMEVEAEATTTPKEESFITLIVEELIEVTTKDLIVLNVEQILNINVTI